MASSDKITEMKREISFDIYIIVTTRENPVFIRGSLLMS